MNPFWSWPATAGPATRWRWSICSSSGIGRSVRIVLKELLAIDPALDILLTRLDCVFVPARSGRSATSLHLPRGRRPEPHARHLLLFPEGNNWTPDRRPGSSTACVVAATVRPRWPSISSTCSRPARPVRWRVSGRRPDLPIVFVRPYRLGRTRVREGRVGASSL